MCEILLIDIAAGVIVGECNNSMEPLTWYNFTLLMCTYYNDICFASLVTGIVLKVRVRCLRLYTVIYFPKNIPIFVLACI